MSAFGSNPGNLQALLFVPEDLGPNAPLVVVLHGCTQTAVGYATGAGWLELAARHGFAVLLPEQQRANNMNLCFNWFEPGDMARDGGEPASIKQMIDTVVQGHHLDPARVFITGLSAGAAMAGVMLATYPETFAAGGLIAGLPYGVATSMPAALQAMRRADGTGAPALRRPDHRGSWPRVSVWHGTADHTVHRGNGTATVDQWLAVHQLTSATPTVSQTDGYPHRRWHDADGVVRVESFEITRMGHGTPIDPRRSGGSGKAGPYVLDVGISSSDHLLAFWGITSAADPKALTAEIESPAPAVAPVRHPATARVLRPVARIEQGVEKVINDALRAAGLMR